MTWMGYIRHKAVAVAVAFATATMLTELYSKHMHASVSLSLYSHRSRFIWFRLRVCVWVLRTKKKKRKTKQFVIQAHLHCMKTHKPTYASHHYISFRELTTNNGNIQWQWQPMMMKAAATTTTLNFKRKVNVLVLQVSGKHRSVRTFYNQNIVCWLQTKCTKSTSHQNTTHHAYIHIIFYHCLLRAMGLCYVSTLQCFVQWI